MKIAALFLLALPIWSQAVSTPPAEPSQIFSMGGGVSGLGPVQPFGYYSMSQHVAAGTYTTEITELVRMKGGMVGTSARAGLSKVLWSFGAVALGIVGDAGAAEGPTGSASGAVSGRGFLSWVPWKHFGFIGSAQVLNVAGTGQRVTITGGIQFRP
jgi:hypothetical protein